jgi:glycosyltransferase involved in cell wall biosynthesis
MDRVARSILQRAVVESAVIPNGVDLSVYKPGSRADARASLMLPQDARVLLFAANGIRSNPFKDFETLRGALSRVAEAYHERGPLILLALGEDCPDERVGAARIRFVPFQTDEEMVARYYRAADLYLHPARADTFPTSVLEAMACGRAVVASAVGGIPEQVAEGETGLLTPVGDAREMAEAILALLADDERRRAMGERAAEVAREQFDVQRQIESVLGWYRKILGR